MSFPEAAIVLSQWPQALGARIEAELGQQFRVRHTGEPFADPELSQARVLLAAPEGHLPAERPNGWPFAVELVQLISSGTDHYPDWLLDGHGGKVRVTTGRGTSATSMAEFVVASVFAHAKRFPEVWIDSAQDWRFHRMGTVAGSTLGIAGFGVLGQAVATLALAVGMKVRALQRSQGRSPVPGVELTHSMTELLGTSDHVVLLLPANDSTRHIINQETLRSARRGMHLINVGRGSLVDQAALVEALDDGTLSRATLDVTEPEPLPERHPLYSHPRVNLSPHTSVFSDATFDALVARVVKNLFGLKHGSSLEGQLPARAAAIEAPGVEVRRTLA